MSIPTREEFAALVDEHGENAVADERPLTDHELDSSHDYASDPLAADASGDALMAAYDAALARIAELERHTTGLHCNGIEAMLPTIPKVPEMIGLESSSLFPEEK